MELRGRNPKGENHGMAVVDPNTVQTIRWLYEHSDKKPGTILAVSKRTNVSYKIVKDIVRGMSWTSLPVNFSQLNPTPNPLTENECKIIRESKNRGKSRLNEIDVQRIRAFRDLGETYENISGRFDGLTLGAVCNICNNETWADVPRAEPETVLSEAELKSIQKAPEVSAKAYLTPLQVREMRWLYAQNKGEYGVINRLAERYNVHKQISRNVCLRINYAHISDDFDSLEPKPEPLSLSKKEAHGLAKFTTRQIREIRWLGGQHMYRGALRDIAKAYGTSSTNIRSILSRSTWADIPDDFETLEPKPELNSLLIAA